MVKIISKQIDSLHYIFKGVIPLKTFRYGICGGSNLAFDTILYFVFYNFVFSKQNVDMHYFVLSPHIASLFVVFPITFVTGFILAKYITFKDSKISAKIQFIRYFMVGMGAIVLSYISMKFLVDYLKLYPTPSRIITIVITVIYSYTLQNKYSFKI